MIQGSHARTVLSRLRLRSFHAVPDLGRLCDWHTCLSQRQYSGFCVNGAFNPDRI